jgi:hypothetical protein
LWDAIDVMPHIRMLVALMLLAGCVSTPGDDPLVWSDDVVRSREREQGDVVAVARFSSLRADAAMVPWEHWEILRGNVPTRYRIAELEGEGALEAVGVEGGSGMWREIRVEPQRTPLLEWRWRIPQPAPGEAPLTASSRRSPMARMSLAFHGDTSKLDFEDRTKLRIANALTAHGLPYATLIYVWMVGVPVDTVVHSRHTDRVRLLVVESGTERVGEWVSFRRNVVEDFRRAYGEAPGDIVGVGLMTDFGDDGSPRRTYYGDISFRTVGGTAGGHSNCCTAGGGQPPR